MNAATALPRSLGRYTLYDEIAAGGMATVHIGRLLGPAGFSRTVAVKRLHPQFSKDPEFVSMFMDEARLAARIRHPNVVGTLDVVAREGELFLVMEYVQGMSLSALSAAARRQGQKMPHRIVSAILSDTLLGLQAAHDARNDRGDPLGIVHRDVSPQNVLVGADGVARVVDFGVAKAAARAQTTRDGQLKGKLAYMSPEQLQSMPLDARSDLFAAGVVLWELLTGRRLFAAAEPGSTLTRILTGTIDAPSVYDPAGSAELDAVVLRSLARQRSERFSSAKEMARALQVAIPRADSLEVCDWIAAVAADTLVQAGKRLASIEEASSNAAVDGAGPVSIRTALSLSAAAEELADQTELESAFHTNEHSEVTELSSSRSHEAPAVRPWRARVLWLSTAVALLGLMVVVVYASRAGRSAAAQPPHVAQDPAGRLSADLGPGVATPAPPGSDQTAEVGSPPTREAAPSSAPSAKQVSSKRLTATRASAKPPTGSCNPPYTLKPDGSKRFKPECF